MPKGLEFNLMKQYCRQRTWRSRVITYKRPHLRRTMSPISAGLPTHNDVLAQFPTSYPGVAERVLNRLARESAKVGTERRNTDVCILAGPPNEVLMHSHPETSDTAFPKLSTDRRTGVSPPGRRIATVLLGHRHRCHRKKASHC